MQIEDFIGKFVSLADLDDSTVIVGQVTAVLGNNLYLTRERRDRVDLPQSHYVISVDFMARNPSLVDVFDTRDDVENFFSSAGGVEPPPPPEEALQRKPRRRRTEH